ncbi:DUF1699 family protein [Thermococcus barophilus]|uniref:Resolvase HTH domain-containing protein n=1 Tax=Thermococcus barophilus (strain DSM 11836 / MP) TaxID=391623 RepID=F0LJT6_THEBM|nr:DUF1699 family protein [Thermococcus barophilus]ADT83473.1 hypothetical protein TERMP_00496 [Thermococcus barophilus MP]
MRVEITARNNEELLRKIDELLNENVREVYINLRPTKEILVRILENAPNVKLIGCPPSLYPKVSKRVIRALRQMGIEVVPIKKSRGRPRKYDEAVLLRIRELMTQGKSPKEISRELGIPLRTVYYMLNGR